jgi:hypothetical protein
MFHRQSPCLAHMDMGRHNLHPLCPVRRAYKTMICTDNNSSLWERTCSAVQFVPFPLPHRCCLLADPLPSAMSADFLPLMPTSPPTSNVRRLFFKRPALLLSSWPCTSTATSAFVCAAGATLLSTRDTTRSVRANSSYRLMASMAISYLIATERSS